MHVATSRRKFSLISAGRITIFTANKYVCAAWPALAPATQGVGTLSPTAKRLREPMLQTRQPLHDSSSYPAMGKACCGDEGGKGIVPIKIDIAHGHEERQAEIEDGPGW